MKKKLLSAMLIFAMVAAFLPASSAKAAGIAIVYNKKSPNTVLTDTKSTNIYVGGKKINLDYNIGGKVSGVRGKWASSNPEAVTVDKYGICKAVGNGTAYITFTYTQDDETKVLRCRMKALTRAASISLTPSMSEFDGTMKVNSMAVFSAKMTTNPKALEINPEVETTYLTYYKLYADSACTVEADESIATVSEDGRVTAKAPGVVYLKAIGKNSPNSTTYNVESMPITITIKSPSVVTQIDSNKFSVTSAEDIYSVIIRNSRGIQVMASMSYDDVTSKKKVTVTTSQSPLLGDHTIIVNGKENFTVKCEQARIERIELTSQYAILDKLAASGNSYPKAYIYFKVYDQFGNDVTTNPAYPADRFLGVWDGFGVATIPEQGVMVLDFSAQKVAMPTVGTAYTISLIYAGGMDVQNKSTVILGSPASVKEVTCKGIYTYLDMVQGYKKMADAEMNNITTGTTILPYNNSTTTPGAYYLLLSAIDQYGNPIIRGGVDSNTVSVFLTGGTTNLALAADASIGTIKVDGQQYLAYPLTAGTTGKVATGTANLIVAGGSSTPKTLMLKIAETAGVASFRINGTAFIQKTGNSYAPVGGYVDYVLTNTSGNVVTDFESLVTLTGATKVGGAIKPDGTSEATTAYLYNQAYLYSPNGSVFRWEKQPDGSAKLYYLPTVTCLISGGNVNQVGVDTITTMKGTSAEINNNSIIVYVQ